jgi:hypothetical protein
MKGEVEVLVRALLIEKEASKKAAEAAKEGRFAAVAWTVEVAVLVAFAVAHFQAQTNFAKGFEAGLNSTKADQSSDEQFAAFLVQCNAEGRHCFYK